MEINVIIFGATGMVGEGVLHRSLASADVGSVLVIGRKPSGKQHPKLRELIHQDFFDYRSIEEKLTGYHACFFCLGVSSVGMDEAKYTRMTFDLTMRAAETLSRRNHRMTFCYVSGTGTDSTERGKIMWARVKGKTENRLMGLPFKAVYLFRPGYIKPIKGLDRTHWFSSVLAPAYPLLAKLFPGQVCTLEDLGDAMIRVAVRGSPTNILGNRDIARVAKDHHIGSVERPGVE